MKGIPTTYSGVRFRSRLEARWAAMFDMLGIQWEYEPFDCDGWIPDFLLPGRDRLLVEVKPAQSFEDFEASGAISKAMAGSKEHDAEVIGLGAVLPESLYMSPGAASIGWFLCERYMSIEPGDGASLATLVRYAASERDPRVLGRQHIDARYPGVEGSVCLRGCCPTGIASDLNSYHDRITGRYAGGRVGGVSRAEVVGAWKRASNLVQWKGDHAA